jgi:hypothetical protein
MSTNLNKENKLKSPYVLSDIPMFLKTLGYLEFDVDDKNVKPEETVGPEESEEKKERDEKLKMEQTASQYFSVSNYSTKQDETETNYKILKYKKDLLAFDLVPTYGLLRSVIVNPQNKVVSFSPPKSIAADIFMNLYPKKEANIIAEDFIEGTMINVFFDTNWKIATRSTVDGDIALYIDSNAVKKSFNDLFKDACLKNNFNMDTLNPQFCYSFVLQHPLNRIVIPLKTPQLYLVEVYEIVHTANSDILVYPQDMQIVKQHGRWSETSVLFPGRHEFNSYSELIEKFASPNTPYNIVGIVLKNTDTHFRTKIRNPIYEGIRHLRGNQCKLMYQYLSLRHGGNLPEYLKTYPESKPDFSVFRDKVHMFTETLHKNYITCYIKKQKPLKEFAPQYKTHMFKIHELYMNEYREKGLHVTNTVVINYVNKIHPKLLTIQLSLKPSHI